MGALRSLPANVKLLIWFRKSAVNYSIIEFVILDYRFVDMENDLAE